MVLLATPLAQAVDAEPAARPLKQVRASHAAGRVMVLAGPAAMVAGMWLIAHELGFDDGGGGGLVVGGTLSLAGIGLTMTGPHLLRSSARRTTTFTQPPPRLASGFRVAAGFSFASSVALPLTYALTRSEELAAVCAFTWLTSTGAMTVMAWNDADRAARARSMHFSIQLRPEPGLALTWRW